MLDLKIDKDGKLSVANGGELLIEGNGAIAQLCNTTCLTYKGDYYLDTRYGIDWEFLLTQKDKQLFNISIESELLKIPEVRKVDFVVGSYNSNSRTYNINIDRIEVIND